MRVAAARAVATVLAASLVVAACGGSKSADAASVLNDPVQGTTYAQARSAVLALYRSHPAVVTFTVKDVEYTPATRDKVLRVCREGGPERTARALESARVLACAPLIFFFYSYGRRASVPAATDVARRLYWYAVGHNRTPYDARPGLTRLLRTWGVQ